MFPEDDRPKKTQKQLMTHFQIKKFKQLHGFQTSVIFDILLVCVCVGYFQFSKLI